MAIEKVKAYFREHEMEERVQEYLPFYSRIIVSIISDCDRMNKRMMLLFRKEMR